MNRKRIFVVLMGLSPFLIGWGKEFVRQYFTGLPLLTLLLFLTLWGFLGFLSEDILDNTKEAIFLLNLPTLIVLGLLAALCFAGSPLFARCRRFLFPIVDFVVAIWWPTLTTENALSYILGFLFMLTASLQGSKVRRYRRTELGF